MQLLIVGVVIQLCFIRIYFKPIRDYATFNCIVDRLVSQLNTSADSLCLPGEPSLCSASKNRGMILYELNDDCLLHLFEYLEPEDLLTLEEVCHRFQDLVFQIYRLCHYYEWSKKRQKVNAKFISRIGNLKKLVYYGMASNDIECFSAVNRYCHKIVHLTLYDVTVDTNLIRLLMPILENLKDLHIDRYLMVKKVRVEGPLNLGEEPEPEAVDELTDMHCLMLCASNLINLSIGEPFNKDSFISHEYLSTLWTLKTLKLNLTRNESFTEFSEYFSHSFLPLTTIELIFPNEGVTDYDQFCGGLRNMQQLTWVTLNNLQNKHFSLLIPGLRNMTNLKVLQLNCAQGVSLSKSVQALLTRMDNKTLVDVTISSLKNTSCQFLWTIKWWKLLRSFEISNCEYFKDEDLLEICSRATNKFISVTVRDCALTSDIVHQLVKISKIRYYNLTFHFFHRNQETFKKFVTETDRTIIQYIHVHNYLTLKK